MKDQQESGLPDGLSAPALRALHGAGVTRLEQLAGFTEAEIKKLHSIGPNALTKLRGALEAKNLSYAGETQSKSSTSRTKGS